MRRASTVLATVALTGCGGDDGGGSGGGEATTVPTGAKIAVTAKDYSFSPKTIVATAGGPHTLELGTLTVK